MRRLILAILLSITFISARKCSFRKFKFPNGAYCDSLENCEQCVTQFRYKVEVDHREIAFKSLKTKKTEIKSSEVYGKRYHELDQSLSDALSSSTSGTGASSQSNSSSDSSNNSHSSSNSHLNSESHLNSNKASSSNRDSGTQSSSSRVSGHSASSNSRSTSAAVSVKGWGVRGSASFSHSNSNSNSQSHDNSNANSQSHDNSNSQSSENLNSGSSTNSATSSNSGSSSNSESSSSSGSNYRSDSAARAIQIQRAQKLVHEAEHKVATHSESSSEEELVYQDDAIHVYRIVKLTLCIDSDCHENESKKIVATEFKGIRDHIADRRDYWKEEAVNYINNSLRPKNVEEISNGYPVLEYSFDIIEDYCYDNGKPYEEKLTLANPRWGSNGVYYKSATHDLHPKFAIDGQWAIHLKADIQYTGYTHSAGTQADSRFYVDLPEPTTQVKNVTVYPDPRSDNPMNYYDQLKVKVGNSFCENIDPTDNDSYAANLAKYRTNGIGFYCGYAAGGVIELDFGARAGSIAEIVAYTEKVDYTSENSYCKAIEDLLEKHHEVVVPFYKVFDEQVDWDTAKQKCEAIGYGSTLVSITSESQQKQIDSLLFNYEDRSPVHAAYVYEYWIGAFRKNSYSNFQWIEESANKKDPDSTYTNWYTGEPNGTPGSPQHCVAVYGSNNNAYHTHGRWNDQTCAVKRKYVCQIPKYKYKVFNEPVDWKTARKNCEAFGYGSTLAAISSQFEQDFLESLDLFGNEDGLQGNDDDYWIGGFKRPASSPTFKWTKILPNMKYATFTYTHWNAGEPNNHGGEEECVALWGLKNAYGKWNDSACGDKKRYICQIIEPDYIDMLQKI